MMYGCLGSCMLQVIFGTIVNEMRLIEVLTGNCINGKTAFVLISILISIICCA